jgi:hypothetical protein
VGKLQKALPNCKIEWDGQGARDTDSRDPGTRESRASQTGPGVQGPTQGRYRDR